jgi:hypothetical protein
MGSFSVNADFIRAAAWRCWWAIRRAYDDSQLVRAMSMFHKTNAARLTPWLCVTTVPLFAFSCVSHSAQQPPWEGCRAASKTKYESAKRDFLLMSRARM